ncbi:glycosyltransferase [Vibrio vulnificus]|uniref:glycosyltransferase n=1 Tax=Vibrio vulnificus TaxID=672 RepID=UPI001CDC3270|nr:glycosyltransferase [Vibrio vulnificus]MCA3957914.1 glycosyltransferase [Vibrio vulnificus]
MSFTIITATYNCKSEIEENVENILSLKRSGLEIQWVVIDGGSSDGTKEKLRSELGSTIDYFESKKDNGIYDAWNKAIPHIANNWVLFMGAGDTINENSLKVISKELEESNYKMVYGNVSLMNHGSCVKVFSKIEPEDYSNGRPSLPCHQGVLHHKSIFSTDSKFDTSYKIAGDSKFLLLALKKYQLKYIDIEVARMKMGGVSTSPDSCVKTMREICRLNKELDIQIPKLNRYIFIFKMHVKNLIYIFCGEKFFQAYGKARRMLFNGDDIY